MANMQLERTKWLQKPWKKRDAISSAIAKKMQDKEPSDPFVNNRVYSLLMRGVKTPEDYPSATAEIAKAELG